MDPVYSDIGRNGCKIDAKMINNIQNLKILVKKLPDAQYEPDTDMEE